MPTKNFCLVNTDWILYLVQSVPACRRQVYQKPTPQRPGLNFSLATLLARTTESDGPARMTRQYGAENEIQFGISRLTNDATLLNKSIRSQRASENNIHWNLDLIFKENG